MRCLFFLVSLGLVAAENGLDAWLRYAPVSASKQDLDALPSTIVALNTTVVSPVYVAGLELQKGVKGIFGKQLNIAREISAGISGPTIVVGTVDAFTKAYGPLAAASELKEDGFLLSNKGSTVQIVGQNERGALYGAFEYLSMLAQGNFSKVEYTTSPDAPIRWVNEWNNLDGSIERGYAGPSIFFKDGLVVDNTTRISRYGRLLASIRVNGIIINNVNANPNLLNSTNIQGLGRIADAFRPWGIRLGISLNFASPQSFGGLATFDPLEQSVVAFWINVTNQIYGTVPDFAGYLVKANSEGQPGPMTYNRTLADGANMFAKALKPHGGIVMFRAFVYNNQLNEAVWKADRANAAVEFFGELDGKFDDNVVVQIKYGPIDFQVREPASPLFANLLHTSSAIELQVSQEYLGQQCHLVYLPPLWRTILDFDMRNDGKPSFVRDLVSGKRFNRRLGGYAAVVNVGTNTTWLGSHLAMSNLYAYGRLAWQPTSDPQSMLQDWIRLTFGQDGKIMDAITKMSMESWPAYENYSGNLGIQTLTDITGPHYGPKPASQDNNGWGQWTRADHDSIGMDRTVRNGTGFSGQYPSEVAQMYENIETTPDDLVLWFHHVPYTHKLHTGKTVIQHFYDAHYQGAETAQTFAPLWETLKGKIDDQRYNDVLFRLIYQAGHSIIWRDAVNMFYYNLSGIPDAAGRVGNHPWRIEAEKMTLSGYAPVDIYPTETASQFRAITTTSNSTTGTAVTTLDFPSGTYDLAVNYYDIIGAKAQYQVYLNDKLIAEWTGNNEDHLGYTISSNFDGHSAARITFKGVKVEKGDTLKIFGKPDGLEAAPLDYISLLPAGVVD
jgi:alpha-glucuronidase